MDSGLIIDLVYQALRMAALLAGPTLLALLVIGLVLGILQAATSINESTVAFVPKLVVFGLVVLLPMRWHLLSLLTLMLATRPLG